MDVTLVQFYYENSLITVLRSVYSLTLLLASSQEPLTRLRCQSQTLFVIHQNTYLQRASSECITVLHLSVSFCDTFVSCRARVSDCCNCKYSNILSSLNYCCYDLTELDWCIWLIITEIIRPTEANEYQKKGFNN